MDDYSIEEYEESEINDIKLYFEYKAMLYQRLLQKLQTRSYKRLTVDITEQETTTDDEE